MNLASILITKSGMLIKNESKSNNAMAEVTFWGRAVYAPFAGSAAFVFIFVCDELDRPDSLAWRWLDCQNMIRFGSSLITELDSSYAPARFH